MQDAQFFGFLGVFVYPQKIRGKFPALNKIQFKFQLIVNLFWYFSFITPQRTFHCIFSQTLLRCHAVNNRFFGFNIL
ncbi:hypothetical protein GALL_547070 [mine drainage metagenome]|uniref:Uncharacterized protein n=1 Tax=mine drainage metagenome TaxID=410659 RepID=A0A1J5P7I7_9ZZZZ